MWLKLMAIALVYVFVTSQEIAPRNPEIYRLHIVSEIAFRFATTNVTSYLANHASTAQEVEFKVTLPNEAFISNFSMVIDGVLYQGDVKEKKVAQKQYDKAKKKGQSAGQVKANTNEANEFKIQINVAAQSKVEFSLTYQELLQRRLGIYEHVISIDPGQVVRDLKVVVTIRESNKITLLKVPELRTSLQNSIEFQENPDALVERLSNHLARITYEPDTASQLETSTDGISGQFVVQYDVERALGGGEIQVVDGYFVHYFAPSGLDPVPKNILFILDVSGSMSGEKINQVKQAMVTILEDLRPGDKFNIATFSDYVYFWEKEGMVAVNEDTVDRAKTFIGNMKIFGGTNINDALLSGISALKTQREADMENKPSIIIFLTDGQATSGVVKTEQIAANLKTANQGKTTLFTLGFGSGVDFKFLTKIALQNNGFARKIYIDADPTIQLKSFYQEVSTPLLGEVKLTYLDDTVDLDSLTTSDFASYFKGSEIVVAGKLADTSISNVISQVSGHASTGYMEMDVEVNLARLENRYRRYDFPHITEKLWAYLTIKKMLELMVETSDPAVKADAEKKALEMALKYDFVTPLTSMVVTKPQEPDDETEEDKENAEPDTPKPHKTQKKGSKKANSRPSRKSFVDNDPHFLVRVAGMEEGICFDVNGLPGDIFQLIYDKKNDLIVNGQVDAPDVQPPNLNHVPTYFSKMAFIHHGITIQIQPRKLYVNHVDFSWKPSSSQVIHDMSLTFTSKKYLIIKIGSDIELIVVRHLSLVPNPRKMDYLGFYIQTGDGLGKNCHGLLGQFHRLQVVVLPENTTHISDSPVNQPSKTKSTPDQPSLPTTTQNLPEKSIRMLQVTSKDGNQRHVMAHLGHRRDMTLKEHIPCWHVRNNGRGLLMGKFKDYTVPKLTFKHFAVKHIVSKTPIYRALHDTDSEGNEK